MRVRILPVFVALSLLAACATTKTGPRADELSFESSTLFGMIYDMDGQPCPGVAVSVDGGAGVVTDIRGRFVLQGVARGDHAIAAEKEGYEKLSVRVSFLNKSDILHLQLTSFKQLLDLAEKALGEKRWGDAAGFLARAQALKPDDIVLCYMNAILDFKRGRFDAAVDRLGTIEARGAAEPAVLLLMADIYEKGLGDARKASEYLRRYLDLREDEGVRKRLDSLGK